MAKQQQSSGPRRMTRDDLVVRRDADGNVEPIEAFSPFLNMSLLIRPVLYGTVKDKPLHISAVEWSLEDKVELVRRHVVEPDLSDLTPEKVKEEYDAWTFDHIVGMVVSYSGPLRGNATRRRAGSAQRSEEPGPTTDSSESNTGSTDSAIATPDPATSTS